MYWKRRRDHLVDCIWRMIPRVKKMVNVFVFELNGWFRRLVVMLDLDQEMIGWVVRMMAGGVKMIN